MEEQSNDHCLELEFYNSSDFYHLYNYIMKILKTFEIFSEPVSTNDDYEIIYPENFENKIKNSKKLNQEIIDIIEQLNNMNINDITKKNIDLEIDNKNDSIYEIIYYFKFEKNMNINSKKGITVNIYNNVSFINTKENYGGRSIQDKTIITHLISENIRKKLFNTLLKIVSEINYNKVSTDISSFINYRNDTNKYNL